MTNVITFYI